MDGTLQEMYEQHQKDVYYYLLGLTHDQTLAEDLTSETFLAALVALPAFRGESNVKTWLFSIARFRWYAHLRKFEKEQFIYEQITPSGTSMNPQDTVVQQGILARIWELLDAERPVARDTVRLRMEGYSFYEIGEKVGISENSARVIQFRTTKKLRTLLETEGFFSE